MIKLPLEFYQRADVVKVARDLLGKILVTQFGGVHTSGRIVETEAYNGMVDKASHAFSGRRTKRTEVMFGAGGFAYVYLCYGIHHLFNVVTNSHGTPHAVLIRGIEPLAGMEEMMERMSKATFNRSVGRGPGNVSKALGIHSGHTGMSLMGDDIFLADDGRKVRKADIVISARIGVDYAAEDASLPYRFSLRGNGFVSGRKQV